MNFTFAITTSLPEGERISEIINSIKELNIPQYEILITSSNKDHTNNNIRYVYFDDTERQGWITRKKNVLVNNAVYENIVLMHDYYVFDKEWYKQYLMFGNDWEICSNAQKLITGKRHFTDWVVWDSPIYPRFTSLDYNDWSHTQYMYQSGGYMVVKKHVIHQQPFNENLCWGQAEDVEWSLRVRNIYVMKCNGNSVVTHNKVHRDA